MTESSLITPCPDVRRLLGSNVHLWNKFTDAKKRQIIEFIEFAKDKRRRRAKKES